MVHIILRKLEFKFPQILKGPCPLQGGDGHKDAKSGCGHLDIYYSGTTGPEKLKYT
jgi:hypothetical protein